MPMSEKLTTTPKSTVPPSSPAPTESPSKILLSPRHQSNLRDFDKMATEAAEAAIRPILERRNGYLAGVMTELDLTGNWDYDADTFTFTRK